MNAVLYGTWRTLPSDLTPFVQNAASTDAMLDYISYVFLHHSMSANLSQAAMNAAGAPGTTLARAQAALYMVLTSGEYQIIQ